MAIFKCKMCGGALEVSEGSSVAVCTFCGTKQTLPKLDNETRINLYDRANHFRRNNDYDKAMSIYEQLLNIDKTDAEAYWSILLCKYGVAYVEDPKTHKMLPTINRAQYTSIFADEDYKSAIHYADGYQKEVYESEAKELDLIQKGILAISQKEEPFDVFICYKETDSYGRRTQDSVLAQDLYYQLTQEGFKVFFSRITLEDKLGTAYEPYIFAALNTAKVMVVIGTSKENLNAVWVKNEWSRFLALTKVNNKKMLIPAYRDMDPYDLPEEFSHLQAQDMSKLGFMQDLIRGIKKITAKDELKTYINVTASSGNANIDALLKRAYIACEDGDFVKADDFAEKILNINPEFAEAYIIKLLAECKVRKLVGLKTFNNIIKNRPNFQRAYKYSQGDLKVQLSYIGKENFDYVQYHPIYTKGMALVNKGDYQSAVGVLTPIKDYKDSAEKIALCKDKIAAQKREKVYNDAISIGFSKSADDVAMLKAIDMFKSLNGYKDSFSCIDKLHAKIDEWRYDQQVKAEKARQQAIKRKRARKISAIAITSSMLVIALILVLTFTLFIPLADYNGAEELVAKGQYQKALDAFEQLDGFMDSDTRADDLSAVVSSMENFKYSNYIKGISTLCDHGATVLVTYDCDGGTIGDGNDESLTEVISSISDLKSPHREGYDFSMWKYVSYQISYDLSQITASIRVKAVWDACEYKITYDLDGGQTIGNNPSGYMYTSNRLSITNPSKHGYTFLGWSGTGIDGLTYNLVIPSGSVGDRKYKANWKANDYTITFNANGGTMSVSEMGAVYGEEYNLPMPQKDGYTFNGWYYGQTKVTDGIWSITENVELLARWTHITYEISYILNGGTNSNKNPLTYTVNDDEISLDEPTRRGYTFIGWSNDSIATPTKNVFIPKGSIGDRSYTANWQANTYTITYDPNGGSMDSTTQTVTYGEEFSLYTASNVGYVFSGWYSASGEFWNETREGIWTEVSDVTLTASWSASMYTPYVVNHYLENADDSEYTLNLTQNLHGTTETSVTPSVKEYENFSAPAEEEIIIAADGSSVVNYYYTRNVYVLTLYPNNGDAATTKTFKYEQTLGDASQWVSFDDYIFGGWYTDATLVYEYGDLTMGDESISLYAYYAGDTTPAELSYDENDSTIYITGYNGASRRVVIPSYINNKKVTSIDNLASSTIVFVELPKTVTTISASAFENSTSLVDIDLANVETIGYKAFSGCVALLNVIVPNSVTSMGESAFAGCSSLDAITIPFVGSKAGVTSSDKYQYPFAWIFGTLSGDGLVKTTQYYYAGSTSSTSYITRYIPSSLKSVIVTDGNILYGAFYNCSSLTMISIPNDAESIGGSAFYNCSNLEHITIPESVTSIGNSAFKNCGLKTVDWNAEECTSVGATSYAIFNGCANLTAINIGSNVKAIPAGAFYDCSTLEMIDIIDVAQWCTIEFGDAYANPLYYAHNLYLDGTLISDLIIPNSVTSIGTYAFDGCTNITSVIIHDDVIDIGVNAFAGCTSLESMTIPFIGTTANGASNTHFGYIFGASSYSDNSKYVPASLNSVVVTNATNIVDYAFYNCSNLINITIPNGVADIGNYAFYGCGGVIDITIPESVTSIGAYGFCECSSLVAVNWDAIACASVGSRCFANCSQLATVNFDNSVTTIPSSVFANCTKLTKVEFEKDSQLTSIGSAVFSGCSSLANITIPDCVTSIGGSVFSGCLSLESITIPFVGAKANVTSSDTYQYPFGYIFGTSSYTGGVATKQYYYGSSTSSTTYSTYYIPSSLKSVTVTEGNILYGAFYNCSGLTIIDIPDSLTSIGNDAFYECSGLTNTTIPDSVTSIGDKAFYNCSALESVILGDESKLSSVGEYAFYGCAALKNITLPNCVENIGGSAFYGCTCLESIAIGDDITCLESSTFYNCSSLANVTFSDNSQLTQIGDSVFNGCSALCAITIPNGVASIGQYAFNNCSSLTDIVIPDSVQTIGNAVLGGCSGLTSITVPFIGKTANETTANYSTALGYLFGGKYDGGIETKQYYGSSSSTTYYIPRTLESVTVTGGNIFYGAFSNCNNISHISIPDEIIDIEERVFYGCTNLNSILIPNGVTSIGDSAFYGCRNITSIELPSGIDKIGQSTFYDCSSLTSIEIPNDVVSIGVSAFSGCNMLGNITFVGKDKLLSIGNNAFGGCSMLTSITIPDSVTSIGYSAFNGCSNLEEMSVPFVGGEQVKSTIDTQKHLFGYIFGDDFDGAYSIQQSCYSSATGVYGGMTYYIPQSLKTVEVKGGKILEHAFDDCYSIENIIIGDKVSYIGKSAFSDCRGLTSINIPDSVTNIDNHAFYDCTKLVDINIGKGVKAIGSGAFHGCSSLTEIIIPEGVERLSDNVFALCTALTSVTIPSSVTSVGTYLFSMDCENLVIKYQGESIPDTWDENWNAYGYTVQFIGKD